MVCGLFMFTNLNHVKSLLDVFIWIGTAMFILSCSYVLYYKNG